MISLSFESMHFYESILLNRTVKKVSVQEGKKEKKEKKRKARTKTCYTLWVKAYCESNTIKKLGTYYVFLKNEKAQ